MQKYSDVKGFRGHRMNLDSAIELLQPNEALDTRNMYEENSSGKLVNMKGFDLVMGLQVNMGFVMPPGLFKCIGSDKDIEGNAIDYFLCDTTGSNNSILRMDIGTK